MKEKAYLMLIFILVFALASVKSYAYGAKPEQPCCKKEIAKESDTKRCCKKTTNTKEDNLGCEGKCGDKSCQCPNIHTNLIAISYQESIKNSFDFIDNKQKFQHLETLISSGFYSIWSPPNIG